MQIGDLVKFNSNGMVGLLLSLNNAHMTEDGILWKVLWLDGTKSNRWADELKVISSASR